MVVFVDFSVLNVCQAKVAYLKVTVFVNQQVLGLYIAVDHSRRVDVLQASQQLVQEELFVLPSYLVVGSHHVVQV